MRQHADEIFTQRDIRLIFNAPSPGDAVKLGVDVRRDLLLVFKEAVSNCARHSQCSEVRIDFKIERGHLILSVADNGVGFDPEIAREGQGLTSMARRGRRLTAHLQITAEPGRGTTVCVDLPLRPVTRIVRPT
jgi:signal transduction histidine kinase